ncbi:MAG: GT4 family glycosyltransferase PelF [Rectinemataceae bacterium]
MILEGTYPYVTGGVSAWAHDLIGNLPEIEFSILSISPSPYLKIAYELPQNVVEHRDYVLSKPNPHQKSLPLGARLKLGKRILAMHDASRSTQDSAMELLRSLPTGYRLGPDFGKRSWAWNLITSRNSESNPFFPFAEYYWSLAASHQLIFNALSFDLPPADLYHTVSTGLAGLVAIAAKARTGKPVMLTEHGLYHKERELEIRRATFVRGYQRDMWSKAYTRLAALCYSHADLVVTLFEKNRRAEIELGANEDRCLVIPNGIDIERFASIPRRPRPGIHIGLVGRIVPIKDIKSFLVMAKIVADRMPEARFWIIGPTDEDQTYYEECLRLATSLGLDDRLTFTGRADVKEYYSFLDVLVLSSVREAQPLVILEGWAAGIPCVSTAVGDIPELLDHDERLLSSPKDPARQAENVINLLQDTNRIEALRERGRSVVAQRYNRGDLTNSYRKIYARLASGRPWQE